MTCHRSVRRNAAPGEVGILSISLFDPEIIKVAYSPDISRLKIGHLACWTENQERGYIKVPITSNFDLDPIF